MVSRSSGPLKQVAREGAEGADGAGEPRPLGRLSPRRGRVWQDDLAWVQETFRARRLRDQLFDPKLFADPSWDIMLALYAAHLQGERQTVADACTASSVPPATALRHVEILVDRGLLTRTPEGGEGAQVELTDEAKTSMHAIFLKLRALADPHKEQDAKG